MDADVSVEKAVFVLWEMTPCFDLKMFTVIITTTFSLPSTKLRCVTFLRAGCLILTVRAPNSIQIMFHCGEGNVKVVRVHGITAQTGMEVRIHSF